MSDARTPPGGAPAPAAGRLAAARERLVRARAGHVAIRHKLSEYGRLARADITLLHHFREDGDMSWDATLLIRDQLRAALAARRACRDEAAALRRRIRADEAVVWAHIRRLFGTGKRYDPSSN